MRRSILLVALVTIAAVGCGGGENKSAGKSGGAAGDKLTIALDQSPTNLDPRVGNDSASAQVGWAAYGSLVLPSKSGDYDPDLAASWSTPDDKTIIFKLRPNLKFDDGRPLTSKDVKYTYDSMLAESFTSPKKAGYAALAGIETPDPLTVVFRLKEPNGGMLDNLTLAIIPDGSDLNVMKNKPVTAGPYRITEFVPDERVEMEANENYYGGAPKIKNVTFKIIPDATTRVLEMRRGTVDFQVNSIPPDSIPEFEKNANWKVMKEPGAVYQYLAFNLKDPILSKKEVRQALAHAVDRGKIVRDLLRGNGVVTETMFPQGHWARAENLPSYDYNVQKAKQMLDAAGYKDPDGDGPQARFKLVYKTSTDAEANQQAEMIQQMLKQVGVDVQIQSNEFGTFYEDIQNGRFQLFSLRRTGIADPDFYYVIFHSKSLPPEGQNRGYFVNPQVDQLIEQGRSTFDRATRKKAYDQIQQIVVDEVPYLSLYHRYNVVTMKKDLAGWETYPSGFLIPLKKMTIGQSAAK